MRLVVLGLALGLAGCAGTTVRPISYAPGTAVSVGGRPDAEVNGLRYYEGAYFVIVYSDGKGGLTSDVKWLPDLTRKRAIDPYAWFAKNEATLTFQNGMLTEAKSVVDETAIPKAILSAAAKIAVASAADKAGGEDKTVLPKPMLYKIQIADGKLTLIPGDNDGPDIVVTLQEAEK
jgi:hypothetical protein